MAEDRASEVEHFEPLYPGDRLRGMWKLTEITPKRTRLGDGVFLTAETRLSKLHLEIAVQNPRAEAARGQAIVSLPMHSEG